MSADETEVKARSMGWRPKDEFKEDPDHGRVWVDAETFVKRGEEVLPFVRADNRRLKDEVATLQRENAETRNLLKASSEAIEELKKFNTDIARDNAKTRKKELLEAIATAKKDGNVEQEVQLTDQLSEHNAALRESEKPAKVNGAAAGPVPFVPPPEMKVWMTENPWFGTDKRRTALANGIADELRSDPANAGLLGRAFFDRVTEEVEKVFGGNQRRTNASKVEESRGGSGGSSAGKSFADLPPDAKEACKRQGQRLIGPGRAFKTADEWQAHYVKSYFEET